MLDPFLGSGTTALAAVRLDRRCIGLEISDEYVQLAQRPVDAALQLKHGDAKKDGESSGDQLELPERRAEPATVEPPVSAQRRPEVAPRDLDSGYRGAARRGLPALVPTAPSIV